MNQQVLYLLHSAVFPWLKFLRSCFCSLIRTLFNITNDDAQGGGGGILDSTIIKYLE